MNKDDWFFNKLVELQIDYRRIDKTNREMLTASYEGRAKDVETRELLIRDLLRALERAQEVIVELGEKSGDPELLKEARVYANAIGGTIDGAGPKPPVHYADNPVIKKYWEMLAKETASKPKARAKAKAPAKTKAKGKGKSKTKPKGKR